MNTTPGYKTTEFWLTLASNIVGALLTSGLVTNDHVLKILGLAAMILSSLGYTVARTMIKRQPGAAIPSPVSSSLPLPRPDPSPYEPDEPDESGSAEDATPALKHEKIVAAVDPDHDHTIVLFKDRSSPCTTLVLQLAQDAEAFSIENVIIGNEVQWQIPAPAFMFKAQPIVIFEKRRIEPHEQIAIVIKNRSDGRRVLTGEAALVEVRA
jgi:hypothetical protein